MVALEFTKYNAFHFLGAPPAPVLATEPAAGDDCSEDDRMDASPAPAGAPAQVPPSSPGNNMLQCDEALQQDEDQGLHQGAAAGQAAVKEELPAKPAAGAEHGNSSGDEDDAGEVQVQVSVHFQPQSERPKF